VLLGVYIVWFGSRVLVQFFEGVEGAFFGGEADAAAVERASAAGG